MNNCNQENCESINSTPKSVETVPTRPNIWPHIEGDVRSTLHNNLSAFLKENTFRQKCLQEDASEANMTYDDYLETRIDEHLQTEKSFVETVIDSVNKIDGSDKDKIVLFDVDETIGRAHQTRTGKKFTIRPSFNYLATELKCRGVKLGILTSRKEENIYAQLTDPETSYSIVKLENYFDKDKIFSSRDEIGSSGNLSNLIGQNPDFRYKLNQDDMFVSSGIIQKIAKLQNIHEQFPEKQILLVDDLPDTQLFANQYPQNYCCVYDLMPKKF